MLKYLIITLLKIIKKYKIIDNTHLCEIYNIMNENLMNILIEINFI